MSDKLKEKIGDWLMDIAKYLLTAVAISSMFDTLSKPVMLIVALIGTVVIMGFGLAFLRSIKDKGK